MRKTSRPEEPTALEPDEIDAEPLAGSGFETEEADPDFDDSVEGREG
ncbi:MAG: hypothetical protein JO336_06140 [Acidobacteriia bacterium]|nr:hypothetical protein [Terriglobia bacterium]